jgi:hypothetical protein
MDVLRQPDERHERDRTVTLTWRTGETVADGYGREGEVIITLDVSHDRYGKRYVASLRRSTVSDGWERYTLGDGVQVYSEPCARFSRSGLARAQLAAWDAVGAYEGDHALVCELVALANREPVAA